MQGTCRDADWAAGDQEEDARLFVCGYAYFLGGVVEVGLTGMP